MVIFVHLYVIKLFMANYSKKIIDNFPALNYKKIYDYTIHCEIENLESTRGGSSGLIKIKSHLKIIYILK